MVFTIRDVKFHFVFDVFGKRFFFNLVEHATFFEECEKRDEIPEVVATNLRHMGIAHND